MVAFTVSVEHTDPVCRRDSGMRQFLASHTVLSITRFLFVYGLTSVVSVEIDLPLVHEWEGFH
jgi:hypothetical protein